ncbi:MAG: type II toxin-antitoxin system RelB/DinJ family antitoxin [Chitinivibrionia bacterium]|jgi:addiction module RelB/DinJ family antitoxin|nr:type II toxin-antitoxin system RelB/DinJ family antitoxin [Chitinivibrionia bacterium]
MTLNVDVDNDVKLAADNLFGKYGLNTVEAMKMFVYTAVQTEHFPFVFDSDISPLSKTIYDKYADEQSLEEAMNDALNDTNLYGPFDTAEEAIQDMLKD